MIHLEMLPESARKNYAETLESVSRIIQNQYTEIIDFELKEQKIQEVGSGIWDLHLTYRHVNPISKKS
jgi:hypothetical protein